MGYIVNFLFNGKNNKKVRCKGKGRGNSGASSVVINYGWKSGVIVAIVDI
ncbi:MAG: hypothetical protein ACTHWZ_04330 [Peptoniphilaceae bacterium]